MVRIRRIGVVATANVVAIAMGILGIFLALFVLLVGGVGTYPVYGFGASGAFLILLPLFYAVVTWVFTALFCLIYNLAARFVGGIELELEQRIDRPVAWGPVSSPPPAPPAPPSGAPGVGGSGVTGAGPEA